MGIRAPAELVPCVLLVEDDSYHRTVFRSFLERRGWRVAEAREAAPAHDLIGSPDVGVVVVDLGGTDGWSLLETVGARAHQPPLLCLTGDARPSSRERATRLGADVYLTKPIRLAEFGDWIARLGGGPVGVRVSRRPSRSDRTQRRRAWGPSRSCYGIEGLRCAEARHPDVVVTDLHMPGLNGVEVARTLRAADDQTPALIAVTADSLGIRAAEHEAGDAPLFDEVLVKPVSPGKLVRTVRAYATPPEGTDH